jgi:SAM-dependent methyltransferase
MKDLFLLNPYNAVEFENRFPNSPLYPRALEFAKRSSELALKLHEENFCLDYGFDVRPQHYMTARLRLNAASMSVFYYIERLLEKNPVSVIDVGCGENLFKHVIDGLYGIDPIFPQADEQIEFDSVWATEHNNKFDAAMAINSLHFNHLDQFETYIKDFAKIIKPGGRGFITFNLPRLMKKDTITFDQAVMHCDKVIRGLDLNYIIVDQNYHDIECKANGNIRLVFEK